MNIKKKFHTLLNLNWAWLYKYSKKILIIHSTYLWSKITGRKFWEIDTDGVKIKLTFSHPYQHLLARALNKGDHEMYLLTMWKKQSEKTVGGGNFRCGRVQWNIRTDFSQS